jgi:hypothetical protein
MAIARSRWALKAKANADHGGRLHRKIGFPATANHALGRGLLFLCPLHSRAARQSADAMPSA